MLIDSTTLVATFSRAPSDAGAAAPDAGALVEAARDGGSMSHIQGAVGGCGCGATDFSALLLAALALLGRRRHKRVVGRGGRKISIN